MQRYGPNHISFFKHRVEESAAPAGSTLATCSLSSRNLPFKQQAMHFQHEICKAQVAFPAFRGTPLFQKIFFEPPRAKAMPPGKYRISGGCPLELRVWHPATLSLNKRKRRHIGDQRPLSFAGSVKVLHFSVNPFGCGSKTCTPKGTAVNGTENFKTCGLG